MCVGIPEMELWPAYG